MLRPRKLRNDYAHFQIMTTRWRDNDAFGHMNNAVFYEYVDSCVNHWLIVDCGFNPLRGDIIGLVASSSCTFHAELGFPNAVTVGLAVSRIGTSSVSYSLGLFENDADLAAAEAVFTHVYVDSASRRPVPVPQDLRANLERITR